MADGARTPLRFAADSSRQQLLVEVSEEILSEILQNEARVCFKGKKDQEVVLCTNSKTFSVKHADSSNSILLVNTVPDLSAAANSEDKSLEIQSLVHHHLELRPIQPSLHQLRVLLNKRPFRVNDNGSTMDLFTLDQLECLVQASGEEIRAGLAGLQAFEHSGFWRVLPDEKVQEIAEEIRPYVIADAAPNGQISLSRIAAFLSEQNYPADVIRHIMSIFFEAVESPAPLKVSTFCKILGISLLRSKQSWDADEFVAAWEVLMPEGVTPTLEYLAGQYLPAQGRFKELFAAKQKWKFQEIKPFLKDLVGPGLTEEQVLLAHSRVSSAADGSKLYSSR